MSDRRKALAGAPADSASARQRVEGPSIESRYDALYDNIPLMYFTLDTAGVVLTVNSHGAHELGYERGELEGRSVLEVFHPEDRADVQRQMQETLDSPGRVAGWEFRKVRKDGRVIWVRESVRTVPAPGGGLEILVACQDITDFKNAELELRRKEEQLRTLTSWSAIAEERERRRIATGLHDDLGGALAQAAAQLRVLDAARPDRQRLREVQALITRAIEATRSLTFELSSPALYELGLEAAIEDLGERAAERHGFDFRLESSGRSRIADDIKVVLFRAVRELLVNIGQHAEARKVVVAIEPIGDRIRIVVQDDGRGFDAATDRPGSGIDRGFGLFSIRIQIQEIGGRFEIASAPGRGTRAVIEAPVAGPQAPTAARGPEGPQR